MSTRTRIIVLLAAAAASVTIAVFSLARMLAPGIGALPSSLVGRFGAGTELALALTGALAALLVSVFALTTQRTAPRTVPPLVMRIATLCAGLLLAVTMPGGVIPAAGYTFAMTVILGLVALVVLIGLRRPVPGLLIAAAIVAVVVYAAVNLEAGSLLPLLFGAFGTVLPQASLALAHVIAVAGLLIWMIGDAQGSRSRCAAFVRRHRRAITVVAAACALPYVVARASWLTPWPLFGGSAELFAEDPTVLVVGLALGAGMLAGGVLTLGLILPWGERFPRFLAGFGGNPVPPALAVIPAGMVSVLFAAAGVQFALDGAGAAGETAYLLLMFPFWLWGPLLGLATWGYAMNRASHPSAARASTASSGLAH